MSVLLECMTASRCVSTQWDPSLVPVIKDLVSGTTTGAVLVLIDLQYIRLLVNVSYTIAADEPCGGECSFDCAMINGAEQCYCPSGYELSTPEGTDCIGVCMPTVL